MSIVFTPARIGTMTVPNRIVRSATHEGKTDGEGNVTLAGVEYLSALSAGGVGLIVTGHLFVRADGRADRGQAGIHDDRVLPRLREMVDRVHEHGARIAAQISHAGAMADTRIEGLIPVAPSAVPDPYYRSLPRELSVSDILAIQRAFVDGALRAKAAGFDGVQLHAAHGYLLSEFLSPHRNLRTDEYGGSPAGRTRMLRELCVNLRNAVGPEFPILVKMNGDDLAEGGLDHAGAVEVSRQLASAGVDAIEVSGGLLTRKPPATIFRTKIASVEDEGYFSAFARAVRREVAVPVISVGGYRSTDVIERLLASGDVDFVAMSRPLIREPALVNRWRSGDDRPAACISCNRCLRATLSEGGLCCPVEKGAAT